MPEGIRCSFHSSLAAHDRVSGVVAALEAHDRVAVLGEQIGDLALALVAPLGADYHYSWHTTRAVYGGAPARHAPGPSARPGAKLAPLVLAVQRDQVAADLHQTRDRARAEPLRELVGHQVGRRHDRPLGLVAGVDDRVQLLEHPVGAVLRAEVVDVQQVDGRQPVQEVELALLGVHRLAQQVQQPRQRVDRDRAPRVERRFGDEHRQRRLAGARRRPGSTARARRRGSPRSSRT